MSDVKFDSWPGLFVATTNSGKLREIRRALDGVPIRLLTADDLPARPVEPEETGSTFAENAALKALAYVRQVGLPTVAEDSGLAINALDGRPGVHSARYPGATYAEKFARLYAELAPHPKPWTARFVCALALALPGPTPEVVFTAEGTVEGEIVSPPRGTNGFGYDPIFFHPPCQATLAEVDDARKLAVSHRGAAFRQLRAWLLDPVIG